MPGARASRPHARLRGVKGDTGVTGARAPARVTVQGAPWVRGRPARMPV